ncbi:MAG TPA: hypothetical protein VF842_12505 [Flavobacterium sp.]
MKKTTSLVSAIVLMIAVLTSCPSFGQMKTGSKKTTSVASAAMLRTNMRKLWEDHVTWTRNVILCLVDELPGTDQAVKRLLQNQVDIGNAIKPYYGEDAGNKLTKLLKAHINISADVVNAAEAGNTDALNKANKSWYSNADEISEFLCKANPKWALAEMKMMMNDHLKLTTNEAVQRIKKNYDADVIAYDKVHNEILEMSDMLADGIIKQFPEKFKPSTTTKSSK